MDIKADIFTTPFEDPFDALTKWLEYANEQSIKEPTALSLATTDKSYNLSSRIIRILAVKKPNIIFTSHDTSLKGKNIAQTGQATGLLYWRETKQQVSFSGPIQKLPTEESDKFWAARPSSTYPLSVASHQSDRLTDEAALRARIAELTEHPDNLPRPQRWCGYAFTPQAIEFWHPAADRFYHRLRYIKQHGHWSHYQLQP